MSNFVQLRYALYERTPSGYQWTWRAGELKETLLDDFKYRIQMPDNANDIQPENLIGGIMKFAQVHGSNVNEHVVLYRFFNGGSDEGRSRVTMLTAWTTRDQLPTSTAANGILTFFRNHTFEHISEKARTIGIEQPYSLISNEPFPSKVNTPSVALAEFVRNLTDGDYDYSLTIQNDNHALKKMPSAAFKYRQTEAARQKMEEEQRTAEQKNREEKNEKLLADEKKRKAEVAAENLKRELDNLAKEKHLQERKNMMTRISKYFVIVGGCVAFVIAIVLMTDEGFWKSPEFDNPAAVKEVVDRFKKLSRHDQTKIMKTLETTLDDQKQTSVPNPTQTSPEKEPPRSSKVSLDEAGDGSPGKITVKPDFFQPKPTVGPGVE